jgi:copper chaperone CopZ
MQQVFQVQGMSCEHCVRAVKGALEALPGVERAEVDLGTGHVKLTTTSEVETATVRAAISEAGYELLP